MLKGLAGKSIVIGGSRKIVEISTLIEKYGGTPLSRPLQGTVFLAEHEVEPSLLSLVHEGTDWVIFTTGIGIQTLLDLSRKLGVEELFLRRIQQAQVASRGYKTSNVLKRLGIKPIAVDEDGTTQGLIRALENLDFSEKRVMVQLHGESAPELIKFLESKGATVDTILPYQHIAPDSEPVATLCMELVNKQVDAVCFTTKIQVRSLFNFARKNGCLADILHSFNERTIAVAIGKVTAEALREEGVEWYIMPGNERMGAMIVELSNYYKKNEVEKGW